ncbi:MAG TPA: hypothetical protein VHX19_08825 [Stellaceae bacterium]|jgi:hypothetical protein|nr:hypothetical protein [Stellaceae bacterium]
MIGRFFGWLFLFVAVAVLVRDGLSWRDTEFLRPETFNGLWYDLSAGSLGIFRGDVLNTMPWLWKYVLAPAMSLWAAPVLFVLSVVLFIVGRASGRRRGR